MVKVLQAHNAGLMKLLLRMALDIYNDCLCETLTANSWPVRSLTTLAAYRIIEIMIDDGPYTENVSFASDLHYRDPVYYIRMLDSVFVDEQKHLTNLLAKCIVFSMQIDGR